MDQIETSGPATSSLQRWADGISVGLVAQALSARRGTGDPAKNLRSELRRTLTALLADLSADAGGGFNSIPVPTLRDLAHENLSHELTDGPDLVAHAERTLKFLTLGVGGNEKTKPPLTATARLIAHLSLEGTCSAAFLMRCGKDLLPNWNAGLRSRDWRENADQELDQLRQQASPSSVKTFDRVLTLARLDAALPDGRLHWPLIENAIFEQLYAWPLLVDPTPQPQFDCYSLPIAVDVVFDGNNDVDPILDEIGPDAPLIVNWKSELREAVDAAKAMWRSKHGRMPISFRNQALLASVRFDFRLAELIVRRTPLRLTLFDRSMIPYFSQVVLHRMLGRNLGFSCAIIGKLGEPRLGKPRPGRRREELGRVFDFELDHVGDSLGRKLTYVFGSEGYTKAVLSATTPATELVPAYATASHDEIFTEVNTCRYLSNVADAVQPRGWRQYNYVRSPEVLRLLHSAPRELLLPGHSGVARVRGLLAANDASILHLPDDVGALALASALHHINEVERNALDPTPPSLAWTFIRATETENDRRFWHLVWQTIGARWDEFDRFRHSIEASDAAEYLAKALNQFAPNDRCQSHRAPDVLVVMGAEALTPSDWKHDAADYRTHLFGPIIEALSALGLRASPNRLMRQFIGRTRLIILKGSDTEVEGTRSRSVEAIAGALRSSLERLSTFRFGFTQQMAKVLLGELGLKGTSVRAVLDELVQTGHLGLAGEEYWVRGKLGVDATTKWNDGLRAERHFAAAKAFAPYMTSTKRSLQTDLNASFLPQNVHEALFHAEIARGIEARRTLGRGFSEKKLLRDASMLKSRLLRYVQLPSPGTVTQLNKFHFGVSSTAAWEMSREQLAEKAAYGIEPLPQELVIYATAGASWLSDLKSNSNTKIDVEEIRREILNLFDRALKNAQGTTQRLQTRRLSVLTHYGSFLLDHGDREDGGLALTIVRRELETLLAAGYQSSAIESQWFELEGDLSNVAQTAELQYRYATNMAPKYHPTWIKLVGTVTDERRREEILKDMIKGEFFSPVFQWCRERRFPIGSGLVTEDVRQRYYNGVEAMRTWANAQRH